jgi:hypothetical protein
MMSLALSTGRLRRAKPSVVSIARARSMSPSRR